MGFKDNLTNAFKSLRGVNKSYTESTVRPSIAQPYMSTDTGAKLPIFPFPLIMIYELADNIDSLRICKNQKCDGEQLIKGKPLK